MSEKLTKYIGCSIQIKCDKFICSGEIVALDQNTIVITKSSINDKTTSTKFLGINQTLIHHMDIIKFPSYIDLSKNSLDVNTALNVYTSATQPPVIKRGGSSSAVHRNLMRVNNNSQESMHKSRSSIFPDNNVQARKSFSENISKEQQNEGSKNVHNSRRFDFNDDNSRTRKTSSNSMNKEPPWLNYAFNGNGTEFDFDSNLALFNKNAFTQGHLGESSNSCDHEEIKMLFNTKKEGNCIIDPRDFSSHDNEISRSYTAFITNKKASKLSNMSKSTNNLVPSTVKRNAMSNKNSNKKDKLNKTKTSDILKKSNETQNVGDAKLLHEEIDTNESIDVFTELRLMGIIPAHSNENLKASTSKRCDQETQIHTDTLLRDRSFLQQPDIVQEVTKSQLCNSDLLVPEQSNILSVNIPNKDFQNFFHFWKIDNDCKFPVFTMSQKDKLFECANKFGYDVREIATHVGKSLSEFVIQQVGGVSRLNRLNIPQIPKIAVILGRCQASVFVASMARFLLISGCYIIAYVDDSCNQDNEDVEKEINLLNNAFSKFNGSYGFNYLTFDFKDLDNKIFDYIITGLESESNSYVPQKNFTNWLHKQKSPILTINPPNISSLPWKTAVFVGVPTTSAKNLVILTGYESENGYFKPRSDGISGLEIDRMFKKPDGLVFLFNADLPQAVYSLLGLNFKSPFNCKNWIRLYRENDLFLVE